MTHRSGKNLLMVLGMLLWISVVVFVLIMAMAEHGGFHQ